MNHNLEIQFPIVYSASNWENIYSLVSVLDASSVLPPHPMLPNVHMYNLGQTWEFSEERPENALIYSPALLGRVLQEDFEHDQATAARMLFEYMQRQQDTDLTWEEVEHRWGEVFGDEKWWQIDHKEIFDAWSETNNAHRTKQVLMDNIEPSARTASKKM